MNATMSLNTMEQTQQTFIKPFDNFSEITTFEEDLIRERRAQLQLLNSFGEEFVFLGG